MFSFENKIPLGVFAGVSSNLIRNVFGFILYYFDYKEHTIWEFATSAVVAKNKTGEISALIIGAFNDFAIASIVGIITVYFIYFTGKDNFILKGFIVGSAAWMLIFIPVTQLEISRIQPESISSNIIYLLGHLFLGILTSIIIVQLGKKALKKES
ncbi:hypothetical protein [Halanaerobacter jeridensis]|uniref:Uncharacterized protein n=1 Tax=Halanaerobacter jeridensis TaxID=706427 RepID=A0A938XQ93_9FIRM|nr:hypothetical protein [Halanaerobacter jeridensis]MBM7557397.1 hypothetical protein [Halanaerobacter jeridensis]